MQTLITVADAGGFARAAGRLHLSQPAASRQIQALEAELGVLLFERIGRQLRLTAEGGDIVHRGRRLLQEADSLRDRADALKSGLSGTLRVGGSPQHIELIQLKGCVVTADALHCHRAMAQAIVARGGDYVLAVKDNQPALLRDAMAAIAAGVRKGVKSATTSDTAHGRKERRTALAVPVKDMAEKHDFPGLKAVARITSKRGRGKTVERYFLMSQRYSRQEVLRIVREHWTIENGLHWPLDVVLDEDLARNRKDNAPANIAVLRRLALNIARAYPDTKTSLRAKLKRAGWDDSFLFEMLGHMR